MQNSSVLKDVFKATECVREAIQTMNLAELESALAARESALGKLTDRAGSQFSAPLWPKALASELLGLDAHVRELAREALGRLRGDIVQLREGQQRLASYGRRGRPEPRFTDRRG